MTTHSDPSTGVQYMLRPLLPILLDDALWKPFMEYAKAIRADAVMAFNLHLEANHPDLDKLRKRLPVLAERFAEVRLAGMSPMINYYVTLGHSAMVPEEHARGFAHLVDGHGNETIGCPCPLAADFRRYISEAYAMFASLDIDAIWIDDDFRLHGRSGSDTFQCFCDLHLNAFAERTGSYYGKDRLMDTLMKSPLDCCEEDVQLRLEWREFQEGILVDLAGMIRDACVSANPDIAMGIMTNSVESMLLNGRDLNKEIRVLRTPAQAEPWVRVGGATYTDENLPAILERCITFDDLGSMVMERSRVCTEIEQFPWTIGGKSARALALELYLLTMTVSPRLTLSINDGFLGFDDVSGNYRRMFGPLKKYLQAAADAAQGKQRRGASLPIPEDPAVTAGMDLKGGISVRWNQTMARIGIPHSANDRTVTLITLKEAVAYSEETIEAWLKKGAVITSEAFYHLRGRGMLGACPIHIERGDLTHKTCVEKVVAPHAPAWLKGKDTIAWVYLPMHTGYIVSARDGAKVWTEIHDNLGCMQTHGVVVTSSPYPIAVVPHTGDWLQETGRQWLYQQLMAYLSGHRFPAMVELGVNIYPVWWEDGHEALLSLANFSLESYNSLQLWIPTDRTLTSVQRLARNGEWMQADYAAGEHPDGGIRLILQEDSVPEHASFETFLLKF